MDYTNVNLNEATKSKLSSIEEQFINMRASGQTVRQIARKLKKSDHTICDLNKKYFRRVKELQKEKLEVLQKKMFEQKQERLDFLTEQLRIVKEAISEKKIYLNYDQLVTLAIKISGALNKCERDMLINELLPESDTESGLTSAIQSAPATNDAENKSSNISENNEVKANSNNHGNEATKKIKLKTKKPQKTDSNFEKQNPEVPKEENKQNKENFNEDSPPRSRADYYLRALKNKQRTPI